MCPDPVKSSDGTLCNLDRNTCLNGECVGSVCLRINETECQCTGNSGQLCHVCCNDNSTGTLRCVSTFELVSIYEMELLYDNDDFCGCMCIALESM